jgi:Txe/YoeB family toxin of toxin-antitoxin system
MNAARNSIGKLGNHLHQTSAERRQKACDCGTEGLKDKGLLQLEILKNDPFQNPPPYEKLIGDLAGAYSRRINIQHRLIYQYRENLLTLERACKGYAINFCAFRIKFA